VASVSFSGFFLRRFMRSRIQLRMLLCVTQAAKKLQAKSFFWREMHEYFILTPRIVHPQFDPYPSTGVLKL
jgi:hypothetical protein